MYDVTSMRKNKVRPGDIVRTTRRESLGLMSYPGPYDSHLKRERQIECMSPKDIAVVLGVFIWPDGCQEACVFHSDGIGWHFASSFELLP